MWGVAVCGYAAHAGNAAWRRLQPPLLQQLAGYRQQLRPDTLSPDGPASTSQPGTDHTSVSQGHSSVPALWYHAHGSGQVSRWLLQ